MHGALLRGKAGLHLFSRFAFLSLLVSSAFILLSGCAQTSHLKQTDVPVTIPPNAKILLMTPDIQLSEITAGGLQEPKADWTAAAKQHVRSSLDKQLERRNDTIIPYQAPAEDLEAEKDHQQLTKLHEAVGSTILVHKYIPALILPTKKDKMDYSLGEGVRLLKENQEADCALFIFMRDSYASAGRVAVIAAAAVLGVAVQGGVQIGFASLVDLETGDIIWFNRIARGHGDLRTPGPAHEAITQLLEGIPL